MISRKLALVLGAAAATVALLYAPTAFAANENNGDKHVAYKTMLTETGIQPSAIPYEGSLQLTVSPDGLISGWYRPQPNGNYIQVTGGLTYGHMWLNIGSQGQLQINADVARDGRLVGSAVQMPAGYPNEISVTGLPRTYQFVASPTTT